jgi:plastocyanin
MKRWITLFALLFSGSLGLIPLACDSASTPSSMGVSAPAPTSTPANALAVTVTGGSGGYGGGSAFSFNPSTVNIVAGGSVTFIDMSGVNHTVEPDNGSQTACGTVHSLPANGSVVVTFPSTGTFNYHCTIHTSCSGPNPCENCINNMHGIVNVE